jgi:hypothetical protein
MTYTTKVGPVIEGHPAARSQARSIVDLVVEDIEEELGDKVGGK